MLLTHKFTNWWSKISGCISEFVLPSILLILLLPLWLGGYYVFIETSGRTRGDKARLISPQVQASTTGNKCLTFWYNMYGQHVDTLNMFVQYGLDLPNSATWSLRGTQGNTWKQVSVTITATKVFNVSNLVSVFEMVIMVPLQIKFEMAYVIVNCWLVGLLVCLKHSWLQWIAMKFTYCTYMININWDVPDKQFVQFISRNVELSVLWHVFGFCLIYFGDSSSFNQSQTGPSPKI